MKHDLLLSIIFYLCGCFYMVFGASTINNNAKSNANRLFLLLTSSLAIWSFSYSISNSAPTAEASAFWRSFSVFGWGVFNSIALHFILVLTKNESRLNKRNMYIMLYLPAFINIILFGPFGYFFEKQYIMEQTEFGWMNMAPIHIGGFWLNSYYIVFSLATIILVVDWWRKIEPHTPAKRLAKYFLISILLLFFTEVVVDMLPDILGRKFFPKSAVLFLLVPTIMLFIVLKKFGLLTERRRETYSFPEIKKNLAGDRLRLFQTATTIFFVGGALSFLVGYFGMKRALENELLVAAALLSIGIFIRFIPLITKKHAVQNVIFLVICTLSMLYIMIINTEDGAFAIWPIYVLFLLFTVTLNDKIHAFLFTIFCVAVQAVFWIVYPKISVTIDGNNYLIRILIIMLSYFAVRYLTNEYALKTKDYRRFAREQEVLERISSSFISINSKNAKAKIDEMLEKAEEILEFSHAYLVEFSADYEDATILNTHDAQLRVINNELFPFYSGMMVKTASLPMAKPLLDRELPMLCEDVANISEEEAGEQSEFFMSRGVLSYFALPVKTEEEIRGVLVVEYNDRLDKNLAESRLYFLKMMVNILGDARAKTSYEEKLYNFAYFDETTKLANKNMLKKRLDRLIHDRKGLEKVAVLDIELKNLRMIKDTFGHGTGEQIMIKAAAILNNLFGEGCDIARSGEGDFVVVLPTVENTGQIEEQATKIIDAFSHPISTETGIEALFVVVRIGISVYPDDGRDADTLLKNATMAGDEAKKASEKIVFYTERLENYVSENTLLTNRLFKSLQNEEFFLEFQPQISCDTGKTIGVEALLRWMPDDKERPSSDRVIPILEQTGLIYDVGLWVLEQALKEHNRLLAKGFPPLRFAVNLSVAQFEGEDLILDVTRIIEKSQVDTKYIELEITESLFLENPAAVIEKLHKMKELGVNIVIDDFGSGYSSLNRLKTIPFDRIKIDKAITGNMDLENKKDPITETIISLAKSFRAGITAEGVETIEQAEFLKNIGYDEIQGYYYSKPLSAEALEEFLKKEME